MPEGLLNGLKDQEVRDLFAYLHSSQPSPFAHANNGSVKRATRLISAARHPEEPGSWLSRLADEHSRLSSFY